MMSASGDGHDDGAARFATLEELLRTEGPGAVVDRVIETLEQQGPPRALLDALLLKARLELGLPVVAAGPLGEIPEPTRTQFEDRYIAAIRRVGEKLLDAGDLLGAWPYFRAIGEKEPITKALEGYQPSDAGDESLGAIVDIAFHQGAHPRRGFDLILENYGTCSAITAFEHLPPELAIREPCAERLTRTLHAQLATNLRAEIARRGQPLPPEDVSIRELMAGRDWLFHDEAYHIDISHLGAVVRLAPLLTDPEALRMARDLAAYGASLSPRHRYEGEPPFERVYEDHAAYLDVLLGEEVEESLDLFRAKLRDAAADEDGPGPVPAAQVLVWLLERLGRLDEAIAVSADYLAEVPESSLFCSSLAELCRRAGRLGRWAEIARERGELVAFAMALIAAGDQVPSSSAVSPSPPAV